MRAEPQLTLRTVELTQKITDDFAIIDHLPENPTTFIRNGDGLVGWGEAVRLEAHGPDRMLQLAAKWRALVATSSITDDVELPGSGLVAFGSFAFADESSASSVLIVPKVVLGSRDGRVWLTTVDAAEADFAVAKQSYRTNSSVQLVSGSQTADGFKKSVSDAVSKINSGELEKVVLARDLVANLSTEFDLRTVLKKLADAYATCWVYSIDGLFGASPELLVRVSHKQVSARVLAGTAGRGTDPGVDHAIAAALAESSKNVAEHTFAVQSLVNELKKFCSIVDADPVPFSLALPNLWHLASDVHAVLNDDASVLDLAAVLHPTAAVAGTPRLEAQRVITELEPFDRGRYAGPVGWIGADGDGEWAIALRGAQITDSKLTAFAGCGIVADSEPEAELAETDLKFRPIIEALK